MKRLYVLLILLLGAMAEAGELETLNVITYNTGLLRVLNKDFVPLVRSRAKYLPQAVAELVRTEDADVLVMEEVWSDRYASRISSKLRALGYRVLRPKGQCSALELRFLGTGMLVAIRPPFQILRSSYVQFRDNTFVQRRACKGVFASVMRGKSGVPFVFMGTQLQPLTTKKGKPTNSSEVKALLGQMAQMRRLIDQWSEKGRFPVLVAGDFNVGPGEAPELMDRFAESAGLFDADQLLLPIGEDITWDPSNPLVAGGLFAGDPPALIDHVLTRDGEMASWNPVDAEVVMEERWPEIRWRKQPSPLSDHYGLRITADLEDRQ